MKSDPRKIYKTRYPDLCYVCVEPGCWRFCITSDGLNPCGFFPDIGPFYASKEELLSDIDNYAKSYGLA